MNNPITANPGIINQHRKSTGCTVGSRIREPIMIMEDSVIQHPLSISSIGDLLEIYWRNFICNFWVV